MDLLTQSYVAADRSVEIHETTVGSVLRDAAAADPTGLALVAGSDEPSARRSWTFEELLVQSESAARAIAHRHSPGERVAIWAPNGPEWVILEYACALAGVVLVTVNPAFQSAELKYVLKQSGASGLFFSPSYRGSPMSSHLAAIREDLENLREAVSLDDFSEFVASGPASIELPEVLPGDPAQIQYTSGTTGFPKGALLHHRGITNNARLTLERVGMKTGGVYVNPMPLFHTGGCVLGVLGAVQRQSAIVQMESFDAGLMLELIETYRGTHMLAVPTMLIAAMEHPAFAGADLSSMTTLCSGGATVPAPLVRRIEDELGVQLAITYGQTEASPVITLMRPDDSDEDKAETLGPALAQTEIKVVDLETGDTQPVGVPGELCCRGYNVMLEYFDMPERTAETIDSDGWLHTGDLVTMDERGYPSITGRLKDMIIRGGENIYPKEIEDVLFGHDSVADVAVVGLPNQQLGEIVAAFVRDAPNTTHASKAELKAYVRERLAPHKTPQVWIRVEEFPLTSSGKIQKFALVEQWNAGTYDD